MKNGQGDMQGDMQEGRPEGRREDGAVSVDEIVRLLDGFAGSDTSRLKIDISAELTEGQVLSQYHHGRCDIGSPWACGKSFDVLE